MSLLLGLFCFVIMKRFLFSIFLIFSLISCTKRSGFENVRQIEGVVLNNPKSAKVILDSLQKSNSVKDEEEMMCLRYLRFLLDDVLFVEHRNVKEIQEMMYFFESEGNVKMLSRSYYAMGRLASDLHHYSQALMFYRKAIDKVDKTDELLWKGKIFSQVAYVNVELNNISTALNFQKKAYECDSLRNDSSAILYDLRDMAVSYDYLDAKSRATSCFMKAKRLIGNNPKFKIQQAEILLQMADLYLCENKDSSASYLRQALALEHPLSNGAAFVAANYYYSVNADDSAKFFLDKVLSSKSIHVKADAAKFLVKIAMENDNVVDAEKYFNSYLLYVDTLQRKEEANDIEQGKALFEYIYQTERAQQLENSNRLKKFFIGCGIFTIVFLSLLLAMSWQISIVRKLKIQNKLSSWKLKSIKNPNEIVKINRQICEQTKIQEAIINRKHLSDDAWKQVFGIIDKYYPLFRERLISIASLSEYEVQVCILVKVGVGTSNIAYLISRAPSTISTAKQRIFKKITRMKGSAEQFDELIRSI